MFLKTPTEQGVREGFPRMALDAKISDADPSCDARDRQAGSIDELIENDPDLAPRGPSALLVQSAILDPAEIRALLDGYEADFLATDCLSGDFNSGSCHESHTAISMAIRPRCRNWPTSSAPAK
jgi:hypothetical protein